MQRNTYPAADLVDRTLESISISRGQRACFLANGKRHGLGIVGDPLTPYLDARHEGYSLRLPDDLRALRVYEIDWDATPLKSGRHPRVRRPLAALGAVDVQLAPVAIEGEAK